MAARRARKSHRYLADGDPTPAKPSDHFEFDEAEVWGTNDGVVAAAGRKNSIKRGNNIDDHDHLPVGAKSLPVNIPDWSKILGGEYRTRAADCEDDLYVVEEEEDEGRERTIIPPHEYLAKNRGASASVHEGVGRTLKGRDLSRVRNAIWKRIGFED